MSAGSPDKSDEVDPDPHARPIEADIPISELPDDNPSGRLPMSVWLRELRQPGTFRTDILAGLTGAVVVLPQGVAFATLAGMPPQYGLYTAMVPCILAALFGSSRQMVTGPANAISLTVLALVGPLAAAGSPDYVQLVITLTFMVACWQLLIGLSGLGKLVNRIPHSVIIGFTSGAAILIANSQIRHLFGFAWERGMSVFETVASFIPALPTMLAAPTIVSFSTIAACVLWRQFGSKLIPYMLVGVVAGSLVAQSLIWLGGESWALQTVEKLPGALPPLSMPDFSIPVMTSLLIPSLIMTLLALAEAMSIASAVAVRNKRRISGTQEILAQGLANLGGSFFSAYPSSGSFNRSGVNVEAGARTPFAAVSAGLLLIVLLAFVSPLFAYLPFAVVAGILVMVAWTLIDFGYLKRALTDRRMADAIAWTVTFCLTLSVSLEVAVVSGLVAHFIAARVFKPADQTGEQ
ncbi:MAG: SulP family inorganic anion transporter [Burkholderiaceae bacterium]